MVTRTTRRTAAKVETEEQKLARLQNELDTLYTRRDDLDEQIATLEEELEQFNPPLLAGDIVKNKVGALLKVLEVAPAFNSHLVRAVVVDKTNKPKDGKVLLYDVSDLELVEEAK